jgi:hypothetical protein
MSQQFTYEVGRFIVTRNIQDNSNDGATTLVTTRRTPTGSPTLPFRREQVLSFSFENPKSSDLATLHVSNPSGPTTPFPQTSADTASLLTVTRGRSSPKRKGQGKDTSTEMISQYSESGKTWVETK